MKAGESSSSVTGKKISFVSKRREKYTSRSEPQKPKFSQANVTGSKDAPSMVSVEVKKKNMQRSLR